MSSNQNVYRVWVIDVNNPDNNKFMYVLSDTEPTEGPNGEPINPALTTLVQVAQDPNEVVVNEPTTGLFQAKTFPMQVPAGDVGDVSDHDVQWDTDIILWQSSITPAQDMLGDSMCVVYNPDVKVGELTQDAILGDNVIHVTSETFNYVQKGLDLSIDNGVKKEELGEILNCDMVNNTITTRKQVQSNFYTNSGTVDILYNYCIVKDRHFENGQEIIFGNKGFRGAEIPEGTKMRVKYTNNSGTAKNIYWHAQFYIQ